MIQSIVHRWPLLSPIFRVAYESRIYANKYNIKNIVIKNNFSIINSASYLISSK